MHREEFPEAWPPTPNLVDTEVQAHEECLGLLGLLTAGVTAHRMHGIPLSNQGASESAVTSIKGICQGGFQGTAKPSCGDVGRGIAEMLVDVEVWR